MEILRFRWFVLLAGIALLLFAYWRAEIAEAFIAFLVGIGGGLLLDWIGVAKFHFWEYSRQPFPSWKYFAITLPCWGILGMAINLLWNWIAIPWLAFLLITVTLMALHELLNLKTKSWEYFVPFWLVVVGWIPLILSFRGVFILLR